MEKRHHHNKKFKSIFIDIYYRLQALPMLILFWILIIFWKKRIQKEKDRLMENRLKLDGIWILSEHLAGEKYEKQQKSLKKLEKEFLRIEKDLDDYEQQFLKRQEQLQYYLRKVFDRQIG